MAQHPHNNHKIPSHRSSSLSAAIALSHHHHVKRPSTSLIRTQQRHSRHGQSVKVVVCSAPPSSPRARRRTEKAAAEAESERRRRGGNSREKEEEEEEDWAFMATAFLQFCATCEKQIMIPSNSILYCSESCRRRDSAKPLSLSLSSYPSNPSNNHSNNYNYNSSPPSSPPMSSSPKATAKAIVAPLTPTNLNPNPSAPTIRIPPDHHDGKSDLDPTEWKPKIARANSATTTEAFRYLAQFQRTSTTTTAKNMTGDSTSLPSLLHSHSNSQTPSASTASSSPSSPTTSTYHVDLASYQRPLPPLHNPASASAMRKAGGGVGLVVPCVVGDGEEGGLFGVDFEGGRVVV
ncbi:hypothetical protein FQN52_008261 [Onygenales sp. PD_12]|nr:hypothetical protein FQN53_008248 [Emmonsiellopsis sp. PD_33]KAK2785846.1 hypothetical protein FQN52_008261 [Onygenales sp. PD_12]